jgi:hypothetical protein
MHVYFSYVYIHVVIHALASMPLAPRLSEADSKTSTGVPCIANAPSLLQKHSNRLGHKCMTHVKVSYHGYLQDASAFQKNIAFHEECFKKL